MDELSADRALHAMTSSSPHARATGAVKGAMALVTGRPTVFARGDAYVHVARPDVIVSRVTGHIDLAMMQYLLERFEEWRSRGGDALLSFHDLDGVSDYDPEARTVLTSWLKDHRAQFRQVHVLLRSKPLLWGFRLLTTLTGRSIVAHSDRRTFDLARDTATGERRPG